MAQQLIPSLKFLLVQIQMELEYSAKVAMHGVTQYLALLIQGEPMQITLQIGCLVQQRLLAIVSLASIVLDLRCLLNCNHKNE